MFKFISAFVLGLFLTVPTVRAEPISVVEAAELLQKSVVPITNNNEPVCTTFKVEPTVFISVAHCIDALDESTKIARTVRIDSFVEPTQGEDWLVINTKGTVDELDSLPLECEAEVYLGMPVAYAGYPFPIDFAFGVGRVMSVNGLVVEDNTYFVADLTIAPGASGAPVISLDTGRVVGVIDGILRNPTTGFYAASAISIKNTPLCTGKW